MKTVVRSAAIALALLLIGTLTQPAQAASRVSEGAAKRWTLSMTGVCPPGTVVVPRAGAKKKYQIALRAGQRKNLIPMQLRRLVFCSPVRVVATPTQTPAAAPAPVNTVQWRVDLLVQVNVVREKVGAPALTMCAPVERAAQRYADTMAVSGVLSHTGQDGSKPWDRMIEQGYQWRTAGENIARGYSDVTSVMGGWINSPGHHANMINPGFRHAGFGQTTDASGSNWWVQNFGAGGAC